MDYQILKRILRFTPLQDLGIEAEQVILEHKQAAIHAGLEIIEKAKSENRDFTEEEEKQDAAIQSYVDALNEELDVRVEKRPARNDVYIAGKKLGDNRMEKSKNVLDYIVNSHGNSVPEEVRALLTTTGAAGGFFVGESLQALGWSFEQLGLVKYCRLFQLPQGFTELTVPRFLESDWSERGPYGIGYNFIKEGGVITETDLSASYVKYDIKNLAALITASRLWWNVTPNASTLVSQAFQQNLQWKLDGQVINGSGIASFGGLTQAACRKTVTRTTASNVTFTDIVKMRQGLIPYNSGAQNIAWIMNPGVFREILTLESTGGDNLFIEVASLTPEYKLLGYPIYLSEHCPALGSEGDTILADLSFYGVVRFGAPRLEISEHAYFASDKIGIKMVYHVDGGPLLGSVITLADGQNYSPIVVLK
jgi:HK97 family phage major capsid protein